MQRVVFIYNFRQKDQFYRISTTSETAKGYVIAEIEKELANDPSPQLENTQHSSVSDSLELPSSSQSASENSLEVIRQKFRLKKQEVESV